MPELERLELECPVCGNNDTFLEKTLSEWHVDASGERQERMSETTEFFCICGEKVTTLENSNTLLFGSRIVEKK